MKPSISLECKNRGCIGFVIQAYDYKFHMYTFYSTSVRACAIAINIAVRVKNLFKTILVPLHPPPNN